VWKARDNMGHALVAIGIGSALKGSLPKLQNALLTDARTITHQLGGETSY
jgi:hypothetical protein